MANGGMGVTAADVLGIPSIKTSSDDQASAPVYDFEVWVNASDQVNVGITIPQPPKKVLGFSFQPAALKPTLHIEQVLAGDFGLVSFNNPADKHELSSAVMKAVLDDDVTRAAYLRSLDNSHQGPLGPSGTRS